MKVSFSRHIYFLMFIAIMLSAENLLYFHQQNLPQIGLFFFAVVIPSILFVSIFYKQDIRISDQQIPKIVYRLLHLLLIVIISGQIVYLIDSLAWILTGNAVIISNVSIAGFCIVAVLFYICSYSLSRYQDFLRNLVIGLAAFYIVIIPILLIYIVTTTYVGALQAVQIGYLPLDHRQIVKMLSLFTILLLVRNEKASEQELVKSLWPAFCWVIFILALSVVAITGTTSNTLDAADGQYFIRYFDSLRDMHVLNVFNNEVTIIIASYKLISSLFNILLLTVIIQVINRKSFVYARGSEYLEQTVHKTIYTTRQNSYGLRIFILIMGVIGLYSSNLYQLTVSVGDISSLATALINLIALLVATIYLFRSKQEKLGVKLLGSYLSIVALVIIVLYFI